MKKLTLVALTVSALALNSFGSETLKDIHVTGVSSSAMENDSQEFGIGYGVSSYLDNGIYWGVSFDFSGGTIDNSNTKNNDSDNSIYTAGVDAKVGYALFDNKLALYGIGSGIFQGIENSDAAGFGYGAGVDYRLTEHFAINCEYKTYSMTANYGDYDYDKVSTALKYNF